MARSTLTREEKAALKNFHIRKLLAGAAKIETVRGPFDEAREELTALFNVAKADLGKGYTRKYLTRLMEKVRSQVRDLAREEAQRFEDHTDLGIPVFGAQVDMFDGKADSLPQEAKDEIAWEAEGYAAGRRVDERKAPEGCPPRMDQPWLRGYDRGMTETAKLFAAGGELSEALAKPSTEDDEDDHDDEEEFDADAAARTLKRSGFLETGDAANEADADQVAA